MSDQPCLQMSRDRIVQAPFSRCTESRRVGRYPSSRAHVEDHRNPYFSNRKPRTLESISLPAIQKVELTHEFDIQDWYMSAYKALVKRSGALSVEEATQLGFEFAIKMAGARERWILTSRIKPDNDFGQSNPEASLEADIIATFKIKPPSSQETVPQLFGAHRRPRKDCWGF